MTFNEDIRLMQQVAAGVREAQQLVLRRVRHRVHVVSTAVLCHREDAEDATQATLIQILRRASTYRGESKLEAWAVRIAAREAMRVAQERRLRAAVVVHDDTEQVPAPVELSKEIPEHIRVYLSDLPEVLRSTLVLRYVLGYTVPEIAETLETSPNTVKDRLSRARAQLRRIIRRELLAETAQKVSHS